MTVDKAPIPMSEAKEQKSDSRVAYRAPAQQGSHICKEVEVEVDDAVVERTVR
jgi:hypothetical protein